MFFFVAATLHVVGEQDADVVSVFVDGEDDGHGYDSTIFVVASYVAYIRIECGIMHETNR
jgi:hypothetical protein